jgi:hypothetical protein
MVLQPIVIGPDRIPSDLDLEAVRRQPELATLAVMMHGMKPGSKRLSAATLMVVKEGLDKGEKRYSLLMDLITGCLDEGTLKELEMAMTMETETARRDSVPLGWFARKHYFEGVDEGREQGRDVGLQEGRLAGLKEGLHEGRQEGRHEGLRQAIALVLVSRRLMPSPAQIERVTRCNDDDQLQAWLRRACEVVTVEQLFEPQRSTSARRAGRSARGGPDSRAATASTRRSR